VAGIEFGWDDWKVAGMEFGQDDRKVAGIEFGFGGREVAGIEVGGEAREVAYIDPGWAVGQWEKGTALVVAQRWVGSLDSGSGMSCWSSGEGTGSVNLLGWGTCGERKVNHITSRR
jgi:hypothetical protein